MDLHLDNIKIGGKPATKQQTEFILDWLFTNLQQTLTYHDVDPDFDPKKKGSIIWDSTILTEEEHLQYCKDYLASSKVDPISYSKWWFEFWK